MRYILLLCVVLICGSCSGPSSFSGHAYRIASDPTLSAQEKMVRLKMIEISIAALQTDIQISNNAWEANRASVQGLSDYINRPPYPYVTDYHAH